MDQQDEQGHDHGKGPPGGGSGNGVLRFGSRLHDRVDQIQENQKPDVGHGPRHHICAVVYDIGIHRIHKNDEKGDLIALKYPFDEVIQKQHGCGEYQARGDEERSFDIQADHV